MRLESIHDFIFDFSELLSPARCADMIERFATDPGVRAGRVRNSEIAGNEGSGEEVNRDKVSRDLPLFFEGPWAESVGALHGALSEALESLLPNFPSLQVHPLATSGYKIQMYPKGEGHFRWHFDALGRASQSRVLALLLYLNDVEQGGETRFYHQDLAIRPRAGRAILFPTGWTHMHCGDVPQSGPKYVVSAFFHFDLPI